MVFVIKGFLVFFAVVIFVSATVVFGATKFSQPEPNIIEINLGGQSTLKEVAVFSSQAGDRFDDMIVYDQNTMIPGRKFCGLQHTDDRLYEDVSTALDEFPWLVDIVHQDGISICPGVLITKRHVLTGYGCAIFGYKVRLGLYHNRQTVSCVGNPDLAECTAVLQIEVKDAMYTNFKGEIALLQLVMDVDYTDFIRPICLPLNQTQRAVYGDMVVASGWGKNVEDENGSSKKRLLFKVRTPQQCNTMDSLVMNDDEFCFTSQERRNDVGCIDDYGGPIMRTFRHQWFVEGILIGPYTRNKTYGYCSESIKPIYGKNITTEILEWIIQTVGT